jgi:hypothetical protein
MTRIGSAHGNIQAGTGEGDHVTARLGPPRSPSLVRGSLGVFPTYRLLAGDRDMEFGDMILAGLFALFGTLIVRQLTAIKMQVEQRLPWKDAFMSLEKTLKGIEDSASSIQRLIGDNRIGYAIPFHLDRIEENLDQLLEYLQKTEVTPRTR